MRWVIWRKKTEMARMVRFEGRQLKLRSTRRGEAMVKVYHKRRDDEKKA
jgi:hypothetical protein